MLCSRFAREVKRVDGTQLTLRDPDLHKTIGLVVRKNQAPVLIRIFNDLVKEIEILVEQRGEPRYRGALASTKLDIANEKPVGSTPHVKTYRGTAINESSTSLKNQQEIDTAESATKKKASKPKMYRGVAVD